VAFCEGIALAGVKRFADSDKENDGEDTPSEIPSSPLNPVETMETIDSKFVILIGKTHGEVVSVLIRKQQVVRSSPTIGSPKEPTESCRMKPAARFQVGVLRT
jgi:hypothetical protein